MLPGLLPSGFPCRRRRNGCAAAPAEPVNAAARRGSWAVQRCAPLPCAPAPPGRGGYSAARSDAGPPRLLARELRRRLPWPPPSSSTPSPTSGPPPSKLAPMAGSPSPTELPRPDPARPPSPELRRAPPPPPPAHGSRGPPFSGHLNTVQAHPQVSLVSLVLSHHFPSAGELSPRRISPPTAAGHHRGHIARIRSRGRLYEFAKHKS